MHDMRRASEPIAGRFRVGDYRDAGVRVDGAAARVLGSGIMNRRGRAVVGVTAVGAVTVALLLLRPDSSERATINGDSVVMLGDSITAEGSWAMAFPDVGVVNEGHPGFTTAQLVPIVRRIATARPRMLFVLTGTNDIRDDRAPSWTVRHLSELLDVVETTSPGSVVVLQTVLPRKDRVAQVQAVNDAISDLAATRGLQLLDLHAEFDDGLGGLRSHETYDGIHLSEAGYERWVNLLRPLLEPTI